MIYPAKLSFKFSGEMKYFHDKEQLMKLMTTKLYLQNALKDILRRDHEDHNSKNRKKPSGKTNNETEGKDR